MTLDVILTYIAGCLLVIPFALAVVIIWRNRK